MVEPEVNLPDLDNWELSCNEETTSCGSWTVSCLNLAKLSRSSYGVAPLNQPKIVSASASNNSSVVAVDKVCVYISETQEVLRIPLQNKIDDLALLKGGFLVIGDSGGTLMTAVVQSNGDEGLTLSVKSVQQLSQNKDPCEGTAFRRVLISRQSDDCIAQIVVLTTNGQLVTVSGIVLLEGDMDASKATISTASVSSNAIDVVVCKDSLCVLDSNNTISMWEKVDGQLIMSDSTVFNEGHDQTHLLESANSNAFFTLDQGGNIHLWDVLTLVPVRSWSLCSFGNLIGQLEIIHSFENGNVFDVTDVKLAFVTEQNLNIVKLPSMESCFEQRVYGIVQLTKMSCSHEDIYVTECKMEYDELDCETHTSVKFQSYVETSSEQRLMKLIARKRFDDAEKLIRLYGLDFNLVPHLVQERMYEALPTLAETQEHLHLCRVQIDGCDQEESLVRHASHELSIVEYRMAAFGKVFGQQGYSPSFWQEFQQANIFHMTHKLLISDSPDIAFSLWRCFQVDCATGLNGLHIQRLLQKLPKSVSAEQVLDWLCVDVIPFLVQDGRQALVDIIGWTLQFVAAMEYQNEAEWPSCAISFCGTILECLRQNIERGLDNTVLLWDDKVCIDSNNMLKPLSKLLGSLKMLTMLKSRFKCTFSLDLVKRETKKSIVYRMLDKLVSVEMLESTLKLQIRPYIEYCELNADNIFAEYIKDLLERLIQGRDGGSGWECKIQALIEIIKSPQEKILAVLNLVDNTPMPIPDFVQEVVKGTIESFSHPLISNLEQKWCIKEGDNLMVAYDLELMPITPTQARSIAQSIAKYFIFQDKPTSMEDARKIMKANQIEDETHLVRCQAFFYLQNDKLPELLQYTKNLAPELCKICAFYCLRLAEINLMDDVSSKFGQAMKKINIRYCSAGVLVSNYLKTLVANAISDEIQLDEVETLLHKIQTAKALMVEFDIGINCHTLSSESCCMDIFMAKIADLGDNAVFRLANLLSISQDVAIQHLVERTSIKGNFDTVDFLMSKLSCDKCGIAREAKIQTAKLLWNSKLPRLIAAANTLASRELITCMPSDIQTWLEMKKEAEIMNEVCHYSQMKPTRANLMTSSKRFTEQKEEEKADWLGDFYQETQLPFQSDNIIEDTRHLLQAAKDHESGEIHGGSDVSAMQAIQETIPCLSIHGHDQLALQLLCRLLARHRRNLATSPEEAIGQQVHSNPQLKRLLSAQKKMAGQILSKILRSSPFDHKLALGYALILPVEKCVTLLSSESKSCGLNFQKLKKVFQIGIAIGEIWQDGRLIEDFTFSSQKAKWGHRLAKLGISFMEAYMGNRKKSLDALFHLMKHPQSNFGILKEFIKDMQLDSCLVDEICKNVFEKMLLPLAPSPSTLEKGQNILQHIEDEAKQLAVIKDLFAKTSSYNYEVLEFLLTQWEEREGGDDHVKGQDLLRLLKLYKRRELPTQNEMEAEFSVDGQAVDADSNVVKLSRDRLPFHTLMSTDPWEFIAPELHPDTLEFWLSVVAVIDISKDKLLIRLATNLVRDYTHPKSALGIASLSQSTSSTGKHSVNPKFLSMLKDVGHVLSLVEKKEGAVWWSHATADKLQRVEEKVTALECALDLAKKWLASTSEPDKKSKAMKSINILNMKLPPLSIQWSLMKCGLWSNETLRPLVKQPIELVQQMYHLAPQDGLEEDDDDEHDGMDRQEIREEAIQKACEEIADVNDLDLFQIQSSLLDSWLSGPLSSCDADQTMTFDLYIPETNNHEDNLKRILFLLKSSNGVELLNQVSRVANANTNMGEEPVCLSSRKLALATLLNSASDEEIQEMTHKSRNELQQKLKIVAQLTILERHNSRFTPESFQLVDKHSLVQSLWWKLKYQREVVPVIASICLDNNVYDAELWNSIIQQMIKLNLRDSLVPVIVRLCNTKNIDGIKSSSGFLQAKDFISSLAS